MLVVHIIWVEERRNKTRNVDACCMFYNLHFFYYILLYSTNVIKLKSKNNLKQILLIATFIICNI